MKENRREEKKRRWRKMNTAERERGNKGIKGNLMNVEQRTERS